MEAWVRVKRSGLFYRVFWPGKNTCLRKFARGTFRDNKIKSKVAYVAPRRAKIA
jgi:hypothetical protein